MDSTTELRSAAASDNGNGGITFTSTTQGSGSSVVAKTGTGNMTLPTSTVEATGTAAATLEQISLQFVFDGTNAISAGNIGIDDTASAAEALAMTGGIYTADAFAAELNTALAGSTNYQY